MDWQWLSCLWTYHRPLNSSHRNMNIASFWTAHGDIETWTLYSVVQKHVISYHYFTDIKVSKKDKNRDTIVNAQFSHKNLCDTICCKSGKFTDEGNNILYTIMKVFIGKLIQSLTLVQNDLYLFTQIMFREFRERGKFPITELIDQNRCMMGRNSISCDWLEKHV